MSLLNRARAHAAIPVPTYSIRMTNENIEQNVDRDPINLSRKVGLAAELFSPLFLF